MDKALDLNYSACVKSAEHFGHTHYQNICSGKSFDVLWGGMDWLEGLFTIVGCFGLVLLMFACVGIFAYMIYYTAVR